MNDPVLLPALIIAAILFLGIGAMLWRLFRTVAARHSASTTVQRYRLERQHYHCPRCDAPMREGYVLGRGLVWLDELERARFHKLDLESTLPNTLNLSPRVGANGAGRCDRCQLLVIDHSRLVRRG